MNNLRDRTQEALAEFTVANVPDEFYMMTDGGDGLHYAEMFAALLIEWMEAS